MADKKGKRGRSRKQFARFKGKIIEDIEVSATDESCAIGIMFQDRTYLSFDVEIGVSIMSELSSFKTGEYTPLKRWPSIQS
jgi:hypothetical protein